MAAAIQQEWSSGEMMHQDDPHLTGGKRSSLLPALPVDGKKSIARDSDSDSSGIETTVEVLHLSSPSATSAGINYPSPPLQSASIPRPAAERRPSQAASLSDGFHTMSNNSNLSSKSRANNLPTPLQMHSLEPRMGSQSAGRAGPVHPLGHSPTYTDSPTCNLTAQQQLQLQQPPPQPWMSGSNGASPRHGPLLTPGASSPALTPHGTTSPSGFGGSSGSLPLPGTLTPTSRKNSTASLTASNSQKVSPGFRGAPLGQTSDTESVLKQFDVYHGKMYIRGQLQKKDDRGLDGHKMPGQQWAAYQAELVGAKLRLTPMTSVGGAKAEVMNLEEATVAMQEGLNGGTFTINWMGANQAIFQPVQRVSLGAPEVGSSCQDWVCAIRLSCYECSRLQEIYTSTLLRQPKFRDQVAATIDNPVKAEGMFRVKFWAGEEFQRLWVVVSDQRGEEIKKKKQGKILQGAPVRGQIHFFESPKSRRPFISMYNVSQVYAVCPSRSSINASRENKTDGEGSLTIKLEGDVVMQRENLSSPKKGFFSSPTPPSNVARDLQALLPTGRSMFAMFQVPNAIERTKFLLGVAEAFRIYGKPGPLLFDSPMDPSAMNFGCMASSLLQQELLIGLDAVLHLPQKGESLADVKFSFGEVLRKRLIAENPGSYQRRYSQYSSTSGRRASATPYGMMPDDPRMMGPPSPLMMMAMRSRANSGSGFLVPQPSPSLHPTHMTPWVSAGSPHSPQMGPYSATNSPRQGPLMASPYNQHLHRPPYASSSTSTDENDANLMTDDEGEDDEYPDSPEEEDDGNVTPYRSRSGSLMVSGPSQQQQRKGSVGALSLQSACSGGPGRMGRSGSFTSGYGVQVAGPEVQPHGPPGAALVRKSSAVLELPSLNSFSDDFIVQANANKDKEKKFTAVVYPTQIVIPKSKKKKDEGGPLSATVPGPMDAENGIQAHSPMGGVPSPSIKLSE